jgi:hypothetical protein
MIDYDAKHDIIYTYNPSSRSMTGQLLLHAQHQILPHLGYNLQMCGVIGNIVPHLQPMKWNILSFPTSLINIKWLMFALPLSKPRCHYSAINLAYIERTSDRNNTKTSVFCGSLGKWNIITTSPTLIVFYHNPHIFMIGSYGFFLAYNFEDAYQLYARGIHNRAICSSGQCYDLKSMIVQGHWQQDMITTWHIKSALPIYIIHVTCTLNKMQTTLEKAEVHMTFHDGPGKLSPTTSQNITYNISASTGTFKSTSSGFQMFVLANYPKFYLRQVNQLTKCKYQAKIRKLSNKSNFGCHPMQNRQNLSSDDSIQLSVIENKKHNTVCLWTFRLHTYRMQAKFELPMFKLSLLQPIKQYEEDMLIDFSESILCLYGGLYIYTWDQNKAYVKVLHWCPQKALTFPSIVIDSEPHRDLVILLVSYHGYSSALMLAYLHLTFSTCYMDPDTFFNTKNVQALVDETISHNYTYQEYNRLNHPYYVIPNCVIMLFISGEQRVLYKTENQYNISFGVSSGIGPTLVHIHHDIGTPYPAVSNLQPIVVQIKSGNIFHPRLETQISRFLVRVPGNIIESINPVHIDATEMVDIDIGVTRIINLKIITRIYCSVGLNQNILYAHHLDHPFHNNFMIKKKPKMTICHEILVDHFTPERRLVVTKIYIKVVETGYGSIIRLIPLESQQLRCIVNETINLFEVHSQMDIIYRYTFTNTATRMVEWHSIFDSDVYLSVKKKHIAGDDECHTYKKLLMVSYQPQMTVLLKSLPPKAQSYRHYNAR